MAEPVPAAAPARTDGEGVGHYECVAALLIAALIGSRLVFAALAPLAFDEAYYWLWSKHLAAGYFDHPPMVAVVIRLGTLIAGDTELGVRIAAVLLAIPATWAVWRAACIIVEDRAVAAKAALFLNLTLLFAGATVIVTPDTPLIVASCFVLFFLAKVMETGQGEWWLAAGAAVGCALLSKYTALFFGVAILAWLLFVPSMRRWFSSPWPWLGGAVALACFAPVLAWNAAHGWASFIKQFGRAASNDWTPAHLPEFIAGQVGLATPSIFILGAMGLWALLARRERRQSGRVLLGALVWPFLLYFLWHSLHARVEANWTAPLFPPFAIAAAAAGGIPWRGRASALAGWSERLAVPLGVSLTGFVYLQALFGIVPLGEADPTARQLAAGWDRLGAEIDRERLKVDALAVLTTSYALTGWLSFYLPSRAPVIQVNERLRWVNAPEPDPALFTGPLLYICKMPCNDAALVKARFEEVAPVAQLERTRRRVVIDTYALFRVASPVGDPLGRSPPPALAPR